MTSAIQMPTASIETRKGSGADMKRVPRPAPRGYVLTTSLTWIASATLSYLPLPAWDEKGAIDR
jgi:hypothetical protein